MESKWLLKMSMIGPCGESYSMAIEIDENTAGEIHRIERPDMFNTFVPGGDPLTETAKVLKRRVFRKDLFMREAERLGALLAERMEDAEGWHGIERQEPAKAALR